MSTLRYVAESTFGTTPSNSANWKTLRITSHDLRGTPGTVKSRQTNSHRQTTDLIYLDQRVSGNISGELSKSNWDDLLESLFCSTWNTNVLKFGNTKKFFTFEDVLDHLGTTEYIGYTGCMIGSLQLQLSASGIATWSAGVLGKDMNTPTTTSLVGSGTVAAATSGDVMNAAGDVTVFTVAGSDPGITVESLTLNITQNGSHRLGVGDATPSAIDVGRIDVMMSINAYFENTDWLDDMIAGTSREFDFTISDGSSSYAFNFPVCKIYNGVAGIPQGDVPRRQAVSVESLYDATDTACKITRVIA